MSKDKKNNPIEQVAMNISKGRDEVLTFTKDEVIAYLKELKEFRENPLKPASDTLKNARVVIGFYAKLLQTRTHDRAIDLAEKRYRLLPPGD